MIRTQVYLTEDIYQNISRLAQKENKKPSQVIREGLEAWIEQKNQETIGDALDRLIELGKRYNIQGPKDLSTTIDTYVYEED